MLKLLAIGLGVAIVTVGALGARAAQEKTAGPIDAVAFIAGTWTLEEDDGSYVEERWSSPRGTNMTGVLRWIDAEGAPTLYELISIDLRDGEIVFLMRHFSGDLQPWKSEETPLRLTLVESAPDRAVFSTDDPASPVSRMVYLRRGDALTIEVHFRADSGREPLRFNLVRPPGS